ncbi:hypothetical protein HF521_012595 [Silurus meridionalis]|uniref:Ig-like domain-containing protein n=1 Tax=Silurus meridionalis TaxID=175797 RepID=A0A8T0ADR4_SILME|nr:hypothetical protein HF521_012595 [Silurus meridionalis]
MYCFRIIITGDGYQGHPGITLRVTDLQVIAPAEVTEGESVILTCKTTCSLTDPTFIWYKNTHDLTTNTFKSNELHLQRVSSEDAGSYNCAVRGSEHLPSPAQYLSVRYPPKNISVSISPSGEIVEGSSVTLTCSSDANPPVETYTWLMGTTSVGKGKTFTISNISFEDSGEYKCMCSNEIGHQNSTSVTLNVLYPPKRVSVSISISSNQVKESSVTLTCSSDSNPPVENYTWFKENEASPVGSGQSYRALQSGLYYCEVQNKLGSERSAAVSITINALNGMNLAVYAGLVVLVCVCLIGVIILLKMKNKRTGSTVDQSIKQENLYENVTKNQVDPAFDSASANQDEALYAKVVRRAKDAESSDADASGSGEDEVQYASVRFINSGAEYRPSNAEDPSVIYSSVK